MVCHLRKTKDNDIDREDVLVAVKTEWESLNLQQIAAGVKKCGGITPQKSAVKSAVKDKDNACEMHISQAFYVENAYIVDTIEGGCTLKRGFV